MIDLGFTQAWLGWRLQERADLTFFLPRTSRATQEAFVGHYGSREYHAMNLCRPRMQAYEDVLARSGICRGKTCLDIGTGAFVTLPPFALAGGAAHVHAVEANPDAYEKAKERIASDSSLRGRVTLHRGFSTDLELPQKVDVIFHEIVGTIGSQEGMVRAVADARERLLAPGGRIVPEVVETLLVPVGEPTVGPVSRFASWLAGCGRLEGSPGLQRVYNPPRRWRIARPSIVERFDFRPGAAPPLDQAVQETSHAIEVERDADFSGFLVTCRLTVGEGTAPIHALDRLTNWGTYFLRVREDPCRVVRGSNLRVSFRVDARSISPAYRVCVELPDGTKPVFEWSVS